MPEVMETDPYVRCTPLEVATGWVHGLLPPSPLPETSVSPRRALDKALLPALERGPCHVTFSGGRDSSAVLAAATNLARREGLPPPVPVTRIYPDLPDTDESSWQELVVRHLGLTDWIRLDFLNGESDLLGTAARAGLLSRGLVWPPALQAHGTMFRQVRGGSLLTGEGGDAVVGFRRGTPLVVLRHGRRSNRRLLGHAVEACLPEPWRRAQVRRMSLHSLQSRWLRRDALAEHARLVAADEAAEPLRYDQGTWFITRRRSFAVLAHNHSLAAAEHGIRAFDPLLDAGFVAALARAGGRWGYGGRTATMRALFADVLPPEVLARSTKASFNHAHAGDATRAFAQAWDGSGVDGALVDPDRLREVWLSDEPTMATGLLLQSAWLASQGATT